MKEEKRQFQQQISSLKADNQRMRTQSESLKSELSKTQGELVGLKVKLELHFNRPFSFGHTKLSTFWTKKPFGRLFSTFQM